jgi:hypothetical protein
MFIPKRISNLIDYAKERRILTFGDHTLRLIAILGDQPFDTLVILNKVQSLPIGPNRLHQTDGMWIYPLRILCHVGNGMRDLEVQPQQVPYFLEEGDNLWIEVDGKLEAPSS